MSVGGGGVGRGVWILDIRQSVRLPHAQLHVYPIWNISYERISPEAEEMQ